MRSLWGIVSRDVFNVNVASRAWKALPQGFSTVPELLLYGGRAIPARD
ncbi:MAG: hypothetical protein PHC51_01545 [bacterium]|nr:hypothetical protein [bacterium]